MTAEEKKEIATKAKQAQMSLTDYLIVCSRKTTIKVTDLSAILVELKRIGNNLNQIARKLNSGDKAPTDFSEVILGQRKIVELFSERMGHRWLR